jgi:predicted Zn-dependent protease
MGHVTEAHEQFRRGIQMSRQGNFQEVAAALTVEDAETHAIVGQCGEARSEVATGIALSRDNNTLERASRALALCGAEREVSFITSELAQRFPEATLTIHVSLPVTAAALAIQRGEPVRGLELLEPVRGYDHAPSSEFWPAYLRGQAHLQLKDGRAAAVEFRRILEHRGEVPESLLYPLAHLGLARAAALDNDTAMARKAYEDFLALWHEADPNLHQLQEARREHSRLQ